MHSQSKKGRENKGGAVERERTNLEAPHSFAFTHVHLSNIQLLQDEI